MIRLLAAEVHRWLLRKSLWFSLAGVIAIIAIINVGLISAVRGPTQSEQVWAQQMWAEEHAYWEANHERDYAECVASVDLDDPSNQGMTVDDMCANDEPQLSWYISSPMEWPDALDGALSAGAIVGAVGALLMGASFMGAEFRHGAIATWLTFAPSRGRVWSAKVIIASLFGAIVVALSLGLTVLSVWLATIVFHGAGAVGSWAQAPGDIVRGLAFGVLMGILGASLAALFRNTVAALAVPFGYLLLQGIFGLFSSTMASVTWSRLLPEYNVFAFLEGGYTYDLYLPSKMAEGGLEAVTLTISFANSALYLLVVIGAIATASALVFWRRDITD